MNTDKIESVDSRAELADLHALPPLPTGERAGVRGIFRKSFKNQSAKNAKDTNKPFLVHR